MQQGEKPVAVIHPGTQHSWQTAFALQELGWLEFYATSIFYQPDRWPYKIERYLPGSLRARVHGEFRRFAHAGLNPELVQTGGYAEWLLRLALRLRFRSMAKQFRNLADKQFNQSLRSAIRSDRPFAVWGYDRSSRDLFRMAREMGRTCILDRTNGDFRAYNIVMQEIYDAYPEFFPTADFKMPAERIERNQEEYELADVILTGSPFAADTVRDNVGDSAVADRVRVLNYCYDELLFADQPQPRPRPAGEPLRFLFVGQAGVRKGIHLLLNAISRIPASAASLTIVGDMQVPASVFARYADRVTHIPTVARADMPAIMREADILVFPSYFEGAGIVLYEALASGLGLIQSDHADVAVTPDTGILLSSLSEEALFEAMMYAIEHRDAVEQWRANAHNQARKYSFAHYRDNIAGLLSELSV